MRLVFISDTHGLHDALGALPEGDVLVHAGDVSGRGTLAEIDRFLAWFDAQPHRHRILVAGNHDFAFERTPETVLPRIPPGVTYLQDAGVTIDGVHVWGSPWQPRFFDWAFNLGRGTALAAKWALIPVDVQVLVTHGPPFGILDVVERPLGERVGCEALLARLSGLPELRVHAFGHIHEAYGTSLENGVTFVNASICNARYAPINVPIVVDLG